MRRAGAVHEQAERTQHTVISWHQDTLVFIQHVRSPTLQQGSVCVCSTLKLRSVHRWALMQAGAAVVRGQAAADKQDRGRGRCSEQGAARKVHAHGAASEAGQQSMRGGASRTGQRSVQGRAAFTAPCTTL